MILLEELKHFITGNIRIIKSSSGIITYYQNGYSQSEANAEGISTCAYVHVLSGIITQSGARRVLIIGCAGGTLATMLHRRGHIVTVVDINPHAFTLAQRYFHMPDAIRCITGDGYTYLQNSPHYYDAIIVDVSPAATARFLRPSRSPVSFCTAHHVLAQNGILLMNVSSCRMDDDAGQYYRASYGQTRHTCPPSCSTGQTAATAMSSLPGEIPWQTYGWSVMNII